MRTSETITKIAPALLKAQKARDSHSEPELLKQAADEAYPVRRVNQLSAQPMPQRFFDKVVFGQSDCWHWRGHVDAIGYGRFQYMGENKAHRVSFLLMVGEIPSGMKVLHKCDVRSCVNPDHLFLGTQRENILDMLSKGRGNNKGMRGEKNPMSKLTADQAIKIRESVANGETQKSLSIKHGVSPMTISRIVNLETWK